jgi:SAM-dependent methyltransferase
MQQSEIDCKNSEFWNELCGTGLAKSLGIVDHSPSSLHRFDEAYLGLYPYLLPIIRPDRMSGKNVLEIGLGYGTLGQKLVQNGANYCGLDIAPNAVRMTNLRIQLQGLSGHARVGSALEMPFADHSFDFVVSIGCFHHTGNVQRCFDETFRVLRPGGIAILMVYNKFSFRQWRGWPWRTLKELLRESNLLRSRQHLNEAQRYSYDHNRDGAAAPETELFSKRQLKNMLAKFDKVSLQKQNADPLCLRTLTLVDRPRLLANLGRLMGLDIYIEAEKAGQSITVPTPNPLSLAKAG